MKKILFKIFFISIIILLPLFIVVASSYVIRSFNNKPFFYNKISNYNCNNIIAYNSVSKIKYAKAKQNCFLFKTSDVTDASYRNVKFIVPETYFVTILNEVSSLIMKVQYKNIIGYVASDSVKVVDFIPSVPSLNNISFDISESVGTQLRKSPNAEDSSNIIMVIPAGAQDVSYIASTIGVIPTGGSSNIWYYAIYSPMSDPTSVYEGYVYSLKTINLSDIPKNEEDIEEVVDENNKSSVSFQISDKVKITLIIIICIPIILCFVLLVFGNRKHNNKNIVKKEYLNKEESENKTAGNVNKERIRLRKIEELDGKPLKKKGSFYSKYITEESEIKNVETKPVFPTYEEVDDDDLL